MSNELSVSGISSIQSPVLPVTTSSAAPQTPDIATQKVQGLPSPSFRIEPSIGVVVMTIRNSGGEVEMTLPSQQTMSAYLNGSKTPPSLTPVSIVNGASETSSVNTQVTQTATTFSNGNTTATG